MTSPRIAIAHEWLAVRAGSEKTFEAMAEAFPDADLYALTLEPGIPFDFGGRPVHTTFLNSRPALRHRREFTLPLMPLAWRTMRTYGPYDVAITSSHAFARLFPPAKAVTHLCYCYAPMRYAWDPDIDQRQMREPPGLKLARAVLRRADRATVPRVDSFAGISTAVVDRINRHYEREARVLFPPVDIDYFSIDPAVSRDEFRAFAISRFIPYKRLDLAIEACAKAGVPLTLAGTGPEEERLRELARTLKADVTFNIRPSDEELRHLYQSSSVVLFLANEDFGIVPVEAQACGTPVIGLDEGGTRDTVRDGVTGIRVAQQSADEVADAIRRVKEDPPSAKACRAHAETFDRRRFIAEMQAWVGEAVVGVRGFSGP